VGSIIVTNAEVLKNGVVLHRELMALGVHGSYQQGICLAGISFIFTTTADYVKPDNAFAT
jgi:hypothetical protein